MYQLEVKALLVNAKFHENDGWKVYVHVDPMEKAKGGSHADGKREAAQRSLSILEKTGASIGAHPIHGRIDIVAPKNRARLVTSSKSRGILRVNGNKACIQRWDSFWWQWTMQAGDMRLQFRIRLSGSVKLEKSPRESWIS